VALVLLSAGLFSVLAILVIATVGAGAVSEQTLKAIVERTPANLAA
jgi:hypothetical protein